MVYSEYYTQKKTRIPIPVTIGVILLLILFLTRFFSSTPVPSRASRQVVKNLQVVNLSPSEFSLFWQTDHKESGWVVYGLDQGNLDKVALDERDLESNRANYFYHFAILKDVQPDTTYYYKIVSSNVLVESAEGKPFTFRTPTNVNQTSNLNPTYGKILMENGEPLENALVLVLFKKAYPLLTLTKTTGEWLIPLNRLVEKPTMKSLLISSLENVEILIYSEANLKTRVEANISTISPLPQTLVIGKDYNFLTSENVLSAMSDQNSISSPKINILFPKEEALVPGGKPLIKGTAIPGNEVIGNISGKKKYSFKSTVDKNGEWSVLVTVPFEAGDYVLIINTVNSLNKTVQLTRKFSIAKSGEQVMGVATGEATPTASPTATLIPTAIPTTIFTTVPLSPTVTPPTSGLDIIPFGIGSASLIILGLGILLAF